MKLLLDQNLSPRLLVHLKETYPGSDHVRELDLSRAADARIWEFAQEHGYTIVS